MITFKLVRKIGKILRGGAGRKEIFLGTLFGVLMGFNPGFNFMLLVLLLVTLLLNANISFVVLGAALGKVLSLFLSVASFHIGFFVIHNLGLEGLFRSLCNAPVTALMDLNVYAMAGGLPIAIAVGILLGATFGSMVIRIRKKMLEADQHEIIGKTFGNRASRMLLRLAFGKSKLSLDDEVPKQAPLLRKSGLILVGGVVLISLILEFFLLDIAVTKGIQSSISSITGAEVNIGSAHLSLAKGALEIQDLQVTDPDKPSYNLVQIDHLQADISISDLLRRNYTIELLSGSTVKRDVLRDKPGKVYPKPEEREKPATVEEQPGKSLDEYFAKADTWKKYGDRAYDYLKKRRANAKAAEQGTTRKPAKEDAMADARRRGYLHAAADLVQDRPGWLIEKIEIDDVQLIDEYPPQAFAATEVSSHPELVGKPTTLLLLPYVNGQIDPNEPTAQVVLRFDDPTENHALTIHLKDLPVGQEIETSDSFPMDFQDGMTDLNVDGTFYADDLNLAFSLLVHDLKARVEEGESILGMDSATATEVFSSMEELEIDGTLQGPLLAPRVRVDYEKLTANIRDSLIAAGKRELSNRANAAMDEVKNEVKERVDEEVQQAREALEEQAGEEINKLLDSEEGDALKEQARGLLNF